MNHWHTQAGLSWMQTLLLERFGQLFDLQLQQDNSQITLSLPNDARCITLALHGNTFTRADSDLPCAQWHVNAEGWHSALPGNLPAPGLMQLPVPLIAATERGWHVGYDILGLAYWMLTRQEEVGRTDLDIHGRFPASASHAFKHGYLERPIIDEWLHVLGQVIGETWPGIALTPHQFSMKVSHDVDNPSLYAFKPWKTIARMMAGHILKRRDFSAFCLAPWIKLTTKGKLHPADPFNTFDWLMDVSEKNNLSSAFYFICGRTSNMDADYEIEHPVMQELLQRIHRRGHEIGLHPSYGTYQKSELIKKEADRLRNVCEKTGISQTNFGGRMHYLRWEQPTTLQAWSNAGMAYDTTLGYADRPGFRCGTCFEYPAFNPVSQKKLSIRIRPVIAMESTVIDSIYLGLGISEHAEQKILELKNICRAVGGCFTTLWHNSYFENGKPLKLMYENIARGET